MLFGAGTAVVTCTAGPSEQNKLISEKHVTFTSYVTVHNRILHLWSSLFEIIKLVSNKTKLINALFCFILVNLFDN